MKQIKIEYNQAVDLSCALLMYARWEDITNENIPGYSVSPELINWYDRVKKDIPSLLDNDIRYLLGNFLGLTFLPVEAALELKSSLVPVLLDYLRKLPAEDLTSRLYATYNSDTPFSEISDSPELIKKEIEKAGGTTTRDEARLFVDFVHTPDDFRNRLIDIMERFFRLAVEPYTDYYMPFVKSRIEADQNVLDEDPRRFFQGFCRINIDSFEETPNVFMSFFSEIDIIQTDNPPAVIYGRCRFQLENVSELPPEDIYSLLTDESRRRILQLLCRKPWFIRELADELGITSATVSYHMNKLSSMNLVTYERGERKRIYYYADVSKVTEMIKTVERDILGPQD